MSNNVHGVCAWKFCCCLLGFGRVFFILHKVQFSFNAFMFCWFTVQHISTKVHNKSWKIQYPLQVWLISPQYSFFFFLSLLLILFISFFLLSERKQTKKKKTQTKIGRKKKKKKAKHHNLHGLQVRPSPLHGHISAPTRLFFCSVSTSRAPPAPRVPLGGSAPSPPLRRLSAGGAGWALGALDGHVRPVEAAPRQ